MNIFYCCHTGSHISLVAASLHLGLLPNDRLPDKRDFMRLPFFNEIKGKQIGTPFYVGQDYNGNKIYTLGFGYDHTVAEKAACNFIKNLLGEKDCKLVNTIHMVERPVYIGSFVSSVFGWHKLAAPFIINGIRKVYSQIQEIVQQTRDEIKTEKNSLVTKVIPFPMKKVKKAGKF